MDDDDAWSLSSPPSSDMLPLKSASQSTLPQVSDQHPSLAAAVVMPADSEDSDSSLSGSASSSNGPRASKLPSSRSSAKFDDDDFTGFMSAPMAANALVNGLTALLGSSAGQLQPAFMLKAGPADPHTTKQEANSIILKEGNTNALAINTTMLGDSGAHTPPMTPTAKKELRNSMKIWQQQASEFGDAKAEDIPDHPGEESSSFLRKTFTNLASSPIFLTLSTPGENGDAPADGLVSPKIITYRKTSHQRTISDTYDSAQKLDRFDPKLYVEEKYRSTSYRYATMKRNVDFHQLFRSHDLTDRLLDDFACALSREILLQGRVYVTEHAVCFNLNLLGWVTSLVVPFEDIIRIDKKSTAGLFPNGIAIETTDAKHNFASFLSRDATYDFIRTIWLASTGRELSELDQMGQDAPSSSDETHKLDNARKISNFIHSIDDDEQHLLWDKNGVDYEDEDESEDEDLDSDDDESANESNGDLNGKDEQILEPKALDTALVLLTVETQLRQLIAESPYKNLGPDVHRPTKVSQTFSDADSEIELCKETFTAPMGVVFDIMFGSNDTSFQRRFLEEHDASEIDEYNAFHPVEDEPTKLERTYTYRRALGYSIGPKLTKCEVSEVIEHLNFADYIVVLNTTATPDVPSGGSFTVKTRYYFTWGEANTTQLRIAYFVKWTGRSWIKNVVEKLTLAAQATVTKDMIREVNEEIEKNTKLVAGPVEVVQRDITDKKTARVPKTKRKKRTTKAKKMPLKDRDLFVVGGIVVACVLLLVVVCVQVMLVLSLSDTKDLLSRQVLLTSSLVNLLVSDEKSTFWEQFTKDLSGKELVSSLARQALLRIVDDLGEK